MTSTQNSSFKRHAVAMAGAALVLICFGLFGPGQDFVEKVDRRLHDWMIRYGGGPPERDDFVLLGIDEASLVLKGLSEAEIAESETLQLLNSRFPWDRRVWAAAIDRLAGAGAKLIVVDLIFSNPSDPVADDALAAAIARHPDKVVLTSAFGASGQKEGDRDVFILSEPYVQFLESDPEPRIGFANFSQNSEDGSFRIARYRSTLGRENGRELNGEMEFLSLAGQIIEAMGGEVPEGDREMRFTTRSKTGGTEVYRSRSVYEIFSEKFWQANYDGGRFFQDKVVMIGPVAPRFLDIKKTPVGPLPGPQLHFQAAACGLNGAFVNHVGSRLGIMVLLGLAGVVWGGWVKKPWQSAWGILLLAVAVFGVVLWLGVSKSMMVPVSGGILAMVGAWVPAQTFQLVRERLEKGRLRGEFRRFVSRDVADRLVDHPEEWSGIASGRKRQVVVLFSDVRDFTSRSEVAEPSELVSQLNEYLSSMVSVVFRHGGTLDKFIGDAVMAHWGALDDDQGGAQARSAIAAAREMHVELNKLNEQWVKEGRAPFKMGVGIHRGDAVAGELGSPERIEFGVIGDAVNLASRIEGLTKVFGCEVMFSSQVKDSAGAEGTIELGAVRVKGRAAPVELHGYGDEALVRERTSRMERDADGVVVMTSK